jgi:hypothetical protein
VAPSGSASFFQRVPSGGSGGEGPAAVTRGVARRRGGEGELTAGRIALSPIASWRELRPSRGGGGPGREVAGQRELDPARGGAGRKVAGRGGTRHWQGTTGARRSGSGSP